MPSQEGVTTPAEAAINAPMSLDRGDFMADEEVGSDDDLVLAAVCAESLRAYSPHKVSA